MPHVAALYRYPLKGFSPEPMDALEVLPSGKIAGDRVLGIRFADSPAADDAWSPKREMLALVNTPGLAQLQVRFDHDEARIEIVHKGTMLANARLDSDGRQQVARAIASFVDGLNDNPFVGHPERLPLRVLGDGHTPRFHDSEAGQITLHGRASVQALAEAIGDLISVSCGFAQISLSRAPSPGRSSIGPVDAFK